MRIVLSRKFWRPISLSALTLAACLSGSTQKAVAQGAPIARERVHPEMVDRTWGPRAAAAWELAFARKWSSATAAFEELHRAQPDAVEPLLGLAFVARAGGRFGDARRWYGMAVGVAPSEPDVVRQFEVAQWDRPGTLDLSAAAAGPSGARNSELFANVVLPVTGAFAVTGSVGSLGAGDPFRGIFLESGAGRATLVSGGVVARSFADRLTTVARFERWTSSTTSEHFLWLDAAWRLSSIVTLHGVARPVSGRTGAPLYGAAADFAIVPGQVLTVEYRGGTRTAPFESRNQGQFFYQVQPSRRLSLRGGVVRDAGPGPSATTIVGAVTTSLSPTLGLRINGSNRSGAFARSSVGTGLVVRW